MVSVIVPVYNAKQYMKRCLDSLANQTLKEIEVLLIDDGSTDGSEMLCDEYGEKYSNFRVFHTINSGVSSARNLGIEKARGEYIAFVDADDTVDLDFCEILFHALVETGSDVAACPLKCEYNVNYKNLEMQPEIPEYVTYKGSRNILESITSSKDSVEGYVWNKLWKKSLIGTHRFDEKVSMCEDFYFTWETLKGAKKACVCRAAMYHYLIKTDSLSHCGETKKYESALLVHEKIIEEAQTIAPGCVPVLRANYIKWNIKMAKAMALSGTYDKDIYSKVRKNILNNTAYLEHCAWHERLLSKSLKKSWKAYVISEELVCQLKKIYIFLKKAKR